MNNLLKSPWAIGAMVVIIALVAAMIYMQAKPDANAGTRRITNEDGTVQDFNPRPYTDALYEEMNSITNYVLYRNMKPYQDLQALSDVQFSAIMQDWNDRYFSKNKESFIKSLRNEYFMFGGEIIASIFDRAQRLNIQ